MTQVEMATQQNKTTDPVEELVIKIVPILVESATKALQVPGYEGLEFATLLLEEAVRYGNLYHRAYGIQNRTIVEAAKKFRRETQ